MWIIEQYVICIVEFKKISVPVPIQHHVNLAPPMFQGSLSPPSPPPTRSLSFAVVWISCFYFFDFVVCIYSYATPLHYQCRPLRPVTHYFPSYSFFFAQFISSLFFSFVHFTVQSNVGLSPLLHWILLFSSFIYHR